MFDVLTKYEDSNHFSFSATDRITEVCNAPNDKAGIYVIYALRNGRIEMVYIGRSGEIKKDGNLFVRKGGIRDRLINSKRDRELRRHYWVRQMLIEGIETLDICWYVTHNVLQQDCPHIIEKNY